VVSLLYKIFDTLRKISTIGYVQYPSKNDFNTIYKNSLSDTECTWWYAGSSSRDHYIALRVGESIKSHRTVYRISREQVGISNIKEKPSEPWHKDILIASSQIEVLE
jgi:hypothetical protein